MNQELDEIIDQEHRAYLSKLSELKQNDSMSHSGSERQAKVAPVANEPEEEEDTDSEAEMETGVRTTKKRAHFTNDELFYDPELDELDESWLNKQRKTCKKIVSPAQTTQIPKSILKPSSSASTSATNDRPEAQTNAEASKITYADAQTDAILNCPCCMTMLTMDCQRYFLFNFDKF